jgi:hypothetical protein
MNEKRFGLIDGVIGGLALLAVVLAVAVLLVHAYPQAADSLTVRAVSGRPWAVDGINYAGELADRVADRARGGWEYRFAGPSRKLAGFVASVEETVTPHDGFPEEECIECHPRFKERPLFAVVYSPHELHGENDVSCDRCHESSGPYRSRAPAMAVCAECHSQTGDCAQCATCHPPGSLFHGAELTGSGELGMQCETCHRPSVLVAGARHRGLATFDAIPGSCDACHEESFCDRCHPATHPAGYGSRHYVDFQLRTTSALECYACHLTGWCAMRCHAAR